MSVITPIEECESLEDFYKKVVTEFLSLDIKDVAILYRGQLDSKWHLLPRIATKYNNTGKMPTSFLEDERKNFDEFKRLGRPYIEAKVLENDWDAIALAQHYGLHTRLLDWSQNPLVALWFAFEAEDSEVSHRAVWQFMLLEGDIANTSNGDPFNQKKTVAFKPSHITKRITAQMGWFTTHRFLTASSTFVKLNANKSYEGHLVKIQIPNSERENILKGLNLLGINRFTLFPDLDGLAKHLNG